MSDRTMTCQPASSTQSPPPLHNKRRLPDWLKRPLSAQGDYGTVSSCIANEGLNTVCVEARCPNRAECYTSGTATFLIMGNSCTRHCGFCGVNHGGPHPLDPSEPLRVARASKTLSLRHIVVTSVTRDDLPDGGSGHFADTVRQCRIAVPTATIELLIPDFLGNAESLQTVLMAGPDILNHNLETVRRLYPIARPEADYDRSLALLRHAGKQGLTTKSGIMAGLGETEREIIDLLSDLRAVDVSMVTIGQYLRPGATELPVVEYVPPEQFARYETIGRQLGFTSIFSGPFVRSSYRAGPINSGTP